MSQLVASRRMLLGDGDGGLRAQAAALLIDGPTIREVRRFGESPGGEAELRAWASESQAQLSDFGDRLVTPAFVNTHTHLALGFLRGEAPPSALRGNMVRQFYFEIERRLSPEDVRAFARMGAYESLLHGVGMVWDHYYHGEALVEALLETGLSGVVAPTLQDLEGPGVDALEQQLRVTETVADSTELARAGVYAAVGPHATDTVSDRLWRRAGELARDRGLPLHAHLAQSIEEYRFSLRQRGATPVAWLAAGGFLEGVSTAVLAHCIFASRSDLELLDRSRDCLVFCPHSQMVFAFPADPAVWSEIGLRWTVATDCSPSNDSMNVQKELRTVAGQRTVGATWKPPYRAFLKGGGEPEAGRAWDSRVELFERFGSRAEPGSLLHRVWQSASELHPAFRVGVLEAGALANLVVWDVDHPSLWPTDSALATLAMGDTTQAIVAMFVAGRQIGQAGDFHRSLRDSDGFRRALEEARERRRRILP